MSHEHTECCDLNESRHLHERLRTELVRPTGQMACVLLCTFNWFLITKTLQNTHETFHKKPKKLNTEIGCEQQTCDAFEGKLMCVCAKTTTPTSNVSHKIFSKII